MAKGVDHNMDLMESNFFSRLFTKVNILFFFVFVFAGEQVFILNFVMVYTIYTLIFGSVAKLVAREGLE